MTGPQETRAIPIGAVVYTSDPIELGEVKEVRAAAFKVGVEGAPDFWLPIRTIAATTLGNRVAVGFSYDELSQYRTREPLAA